MSSQRVIEENGFKWKTDQKLKITGVQIAWINAKLKRNKKIALILYMKMNEILFKKQSWWKLSLKKYQKWSVIQIMKIVLNILNTINAANWNCL